MRLPLSIQRKAAAHPCPPAAGHADHMTARRCIIVTAALVGVLASLRVDSNCVAEQVGRPLRRLPGMQPVEPPPPPAVPPARDAAQPAPAAASETPPPSPTSQPTAPGAEPPSSTGGETAEVRKKLEAIRADESLPEEVRSRCQEVLSTVLKDLDRRDKAVSQTRQLKAAADSAATRKQAAESSAGTKVEVDLEGIGPESPAETIDALLKRLEADLASSTGRSKAIQQQINERRTESKELPQQIATLEEELAAIKPPPEEDTAINPVLAQALKQSAAVEQQAAEASLQLARQKLATYEAESTVLPLEQAQLARQAAAITEAIGQVSRWASRRRQDDITTRVSDFRAAAEAAAVTDQAALEQALDIFAEWPAFVADVQRWDAELLRLREVTENLRNDFHETESLVEADRATGSGLSRSAGSLLKRKRVMLSRTRSLLKDAGEQAAAVDDAQDVLADIDTLIDELDQGVPAKTKPETPTLVERQRALL